MTQDKDQMRAEFEQWAATQADSWLLIGGLTWSPGTNDYASDRTNAAWAAWQAARASAPQSAFDVIKECEAALAEELGAWDIDPPIHHVKKAHEACVAWLAAAPQPVAQTMDKSN